MIKYQTMKTFYRVITNVSGEIHFKQRKICKAYRRWLRENGIDYKSDFFIKKIK
jgi:hypothetical protein